MSNDLSAIGFRPLQADAPVRSAAAPAEAPVANVQTQQAAMKGRIVPATKEAAKPETKPAVKFDPEEVQKNLREAIDRLNEQAEKNGRGLNFSVDEELNRHVITVRNTSSGEVVRQIPTEVAIKVAHNIEDVKGLLLDEQN